MPTSEYHEDRVPPPTPIPATELVRLFHLDYHNHTRFCFILGAGASKTSGIKTGVEMVSDWRAELLEHYHHNTKEIFDLAERMHYLEDCKRIFDDGYQADGDDYFTLYDLMYGETIQAGYSYMEKAMAHSKPSLGYYCLASILNDRTFGSNLVITTNFDSLTEDALFLYSGKHPLVLGHERMASFLNSQIDRPVVAKIHRDLLLKPMSRSEEMSKLKDEWHKALRSILPFYIPIVIGYDGSDHTLMDLLQESDLGCQKLYWCTLNTTNELKENVQKVLKNTNGKWVQISGFDELMYQLSASINLLPDENVLQETASKRIEYYKTIYENFKKYDVLIDPSEALTKVDEHTMDVLLTIYREHMHKKPNLLQRCYECFQKGWGYYVNKSYESALKLFSDAISANGNISFHYLWRSHTYAALKQYTEALNDLDCAIEHSPTDDTLYYHRAVLNRTIKHYDAAKRDICTAIYIWANKNELQQRLTDMTPDQIMKSIDHAVKKCDISAEFQKITVFPRKKAAYGDEFNRISDLSKNENTPKKATNTLSVEDVFGEDADSFFADGIAKLDSGKLAEAEALLQKAISKKKDDPRYYYYRGKVQYAQENYGEALNSLNRAISFNSNIAEYHHLSSMTLLKLNWLTEALKSIERAISLDPKNKEYIQLRESIIKELPPL